PRRTRHHERAHLARHWRGPGQGRVPWRHPDPRGRRRYRRQPVQQEPAAVGRGGDQHPADAGDPRRRGAGRPWRHRRPAGPGLDVLPALARHPARPGTGDAHRRVLPRAAFGDRRGRGPRRDRCAAGHGVAAFGRRGHGGGMSLEPPQPGSRPPTAEGAAPVDWAAIRADFPVLQRQVHGKPLVYLDSANTGQKPVQVIKAVDDFFRHHNANVSRAVHALGTEATEAYEGARGKLARFLNVRPNELVLCSGTTFAINLVAYSWALPRLRTGDAIVVTRMEHHANIVLWQLIAQRTGATLKVADID